MSATKQLSLALRDWSEVLITRSMHDLMRFVRDAGLTMAQFSTLMRLYHSHHCGVSDVGTQLGVSNAAASQLVDKLVQHGLLERAEAAHDRRMKDLTLTAQGRALVERSLEARLGWADAVAEALSPDRREAVRQALLHLVEAARQTEH